MSSGRWMTYPSKLCTRQISGVKKLQLFYVKAGAFALHAGILIFRAQSFEANRDECIGISGAGYFTQC